jgi:hypothetical protein
MKGGLGSGVWKSRLLLDAHTNTDQRIHIHGLAPIQHGMKDPLAHRVFQAWAGRSATDYAKVLHVSGGIEQAGKDHACARAPPAYL